MPFEPTPPDLPPWDPASAREEVEILSELDTREWALIRYVGQPMGEFIPLPLEGLSIGRAPENGLRLPEPEVSRHHARLTIAADLETVELRDLGSTNGVFINGKRVHADPGPLKLRAEDVVRVGGHAFKLKHMDALERRYHQIANQPDMVKLVLRLSPQLGQLCQIRRIADGVDLAAQ